MATKEKAAKPAAKDVPPEWTAAYKAMVLRGEIKPKP